MRERSSRSLCSLRCLVGLLMEGPSGPDMGSAPPLLIAMRVPPAVDLIQVLVSHEVNARFARAPARAFGSIVRNTTNPDAMSDARSATRRALHRASAAVRRRWYGGCSCRPFMSALRDRRRRNPNPHFHARLGGRGGRWRRPGRCLLSRRWTAAPMRAPSAPCIGADLAQTKAVLATCTWTEWLGGPKRYSEPSAAQPRLRPCARALRASTRAARRRVAGLHGARHSTRSATEACAARRAARRLRQGRQIT